MTTKVFNVAAILPAITVLYLAPPITAADAPTKQRSAQETPISDKELNAFAKVYVDYQQIRSSYGPALDRAKDPRQKQRIEEEANTKLKRSLDGAGLTSERYNQIFARVNADEELRKKVLKKVDEERRKS